MRTVIHVCPKNAGDQKAKCFASVLETVPLWFIVTPLWFRYTVIKLHVLHLCHLLKKNLTWQRVVPSHNDDAIKDLNVVLWSMTTPSHAFLGKSEQNEWELTTVSSSKLRSSTLKKKKKKCSVIYVMHFVWPLCNVSRSNILD